VCLHGNGFTLRTGAPGALFRIGPLNVDKIGKYQILETIGRGGMGVVYKALDPRIGRVVAVKTIFSQRDTDPEMRQRFLQEARSAGALSHKNIITIYEMDEDAGQSFIAMEYLEGEDLKSIIARRASMSLEQKLRILVEVCEGLAHAHSMGVIHRDIKPGNIFLTRAGQVKILDFGLARQSTSDLTQTQTSMGTPSYMSAEQVRGEKLDHRTDIFSFGVVAYELLTYTKPFQAETDFGLIFKITYTEPEPVDKVNPALPVELSGVISGALEKDREKRYQQADDLLRELEAVVGIVEERKRTLRKEVREAIGRLEELVRTHPGVIEDVAEKLEEMKQAAPEFFEATILTRSGRSTARRHSLRLEYFELIEFRDRARREFDRVSSLLEVRQKQSPLLQEAEDLRGSGKLEAALQVVDSMLREDPSYAPALAFRKKITSQIKKNELERQRAELISRLMGEAEARLADEEFDACRQSLERVLKLQADHAKALALEASLQEKIAEKKAREERRRQAEELIARSRQALAEGRFPAARDHLVSALAECPGLPGSAELREEIEQAGKEAEERRKRETLVSGLHAEAKALDQAGREEEALARLHQLLQMQPDHSPALELRAAIENRLAKRRRVEDLVKEAAAHTAEDRHDAARRALLQALELEPERAEALTLLEQVKRKIEEQEKQRRDREQKIGTLMQESLEFRGTGSIDRALDSLAQLLDLEPGHREALRLKREIESERKAAELAAQKRRERIAAMLRRATEAADRGDLENAISLARSLDPEAQAESDAGDLIAAWEAELERRRETERRKLQKIDRLLDAARQLIEAGELQEARKPLQEILGLQVDHAEAHKLLRRIREDLEAEQLRLAQAEEGRRQKSLGLRLLAERKYQAALTALRHAVELLGDEAGVEAAIQEAESEIRAGQQRLKVDAGLVEARRLLAAGLHEGAHAEILEVLKLSPRHVEARELLARIEAELEQVRIRARIAELLAQTRQSLGARDLDAASRTASEILVLDGGNSEARDVLARVEEMQGEKSLRLEIAALLARSSQALAAGDYRQSAVLAREALLLDEDNADARQLLKRIDEAQEAGHKQERIASLLLQSRREHADGDLESALTHVGEVLRLDSALKEAAALRKDLEKEIRTRKKEQEREQKRLALEQRRARKAQDAATAVLPGRRNLAAWIRSPIVLIVIAVSLAAGVYYGIIRTPEGAQFVVLSEPDGVEVLLNGRPVGITSSGSLSLRNLPTGPGTLTATKEGYTTFSRSLDLVSGENPDLNISLEPAGAELQVRTDQTDVGVQVDGVELGRTSSAGAMQSFRIGGGRHTVSLIKEGYEVQKKELSFAPGQMILIEESLRPLAVKTNASVLRILTNPADAEVYLDGKKVGTTVGGSLVLQDLKPGTARLLLKKDGYNDSEKILTLEAGRALDHVVNLAAKAATLVLATNAPGAGVWIDNTSRGKTDASGNLTLNNLPPDSRSLRIAAEGYQEKTDLLNLRPGGTSRMQITLAPAVVAPALLSIASLPEKAEVFIDEEYKGVTPLNALRLEPGTRRIRLRKEGYRDAERSVDLRAGEPRAESIPLERLLGILEFNIQPENASARIGSQTYDLSKQRQLDLEPGTYTVELSAPGRKPGQQTVTIQGGRTTQLQFVLEALPAPPARGYTDAFLGLDNWQHPPDWLGDGLLHAVGRGLAILKDRVYEDFSQQFQLRLTSGVTASWIVRCQDERNYCLIQINSDRHPEKIRKNTIYFSTTLDGRQTAVSPLPLPFQFGAGRSEWVDIQMEVRGDLIIARVNVATGTSVTRTEMGRYNIPAGLPARGRIGFAVFEDEEFDVSSLVIDPIR
jgi:serine/threonine protein kinase